MVNLFRKLSIFFLAFSFLAPQLAMAETPAGEPETVQEAGMKSRCANIPDGYKECADSPTECESNEEGRHPFNCLFLQEPIGGRPGYDMFKVTCTENENDEPLCQYVLWYGEAIVGNDAGPFQAILTYEEGKEFQGPFGLLYGYLGLVYNFMSGLIIGFVILVVIIGGVRMTTAAGNQDSFNQGKSMIIKALIGMVLWFTASVILYTINPTFFAF